MGVPALCTKRNEYPIVRQQLMMLKRRKILTGSYLILALIIAGIACVRAFSSRNSNRSDLHITAEPIQLSDGWGYKIEVNNRPFIYQNQIPCIAGNKPFPTEKSAMAVAQVVLKKIEHGQLPTITLSELTRASGLHVFQ